MPAATHRLRLIHSGKLLKDTDILSSVLKLPVPPPPRLPTHDPKGKGKAPEHTSAERDGAIVGKVYINCSIGDVLTPSELAAEAAAAISSPNPLVQSPATSASEENRRSDGVTEGQLATPAPQGFDRLLSSGFTSTEVQQLRLQFLNIQSNIHTASSMPSPSTLRRMEDAWLDSNSFGTTGTGSQPGLGTETLDLGDDGLGGGALDDLLWGNVMGFLWPLGCIGWVIREGGVWSRRRGMAVFTGGLVGMLFGILRVVA